MQLQDLVVIWLIQYKDQHIVSLQSRPDLVLMFSVSVGRVYRLMRSMELPKMSTDRPKHRPSHPSRTEDNACRNHLKQRFSQDAPNLVWVSDFTYIKAGGKWCYLCVVIDLFSRKVVSWQLSDKADTALVMNAFRKAYEKRGRPQGLMFHSDRGTQYTAEPFRKLLDELHVVQSFSKKGYPFDNAVCESFFRQFKREEADRRTYRSRQELYLAVLNTSRASTIHTGLMRLLAG